MRQNILSIWNGLDLRRRLILAGATLAVFLAILLLARGTGSSGMSLLYAGLEDRAAGPVITALDQRGIPYEVRGTAIWVPEAQRDPLRMALAAEGLPPAGGQGYELLDGLSGFGTTAQMFDAAYWRAKEGELARTILTMPGIRAARVHISQGPSHVFQARISPTASVTVTSASGQLGEDQARALKHLIASAVTGLRPADVEVIDSSGGLIGGEDRSLAGNGAATERAAQIRNGIERLLAARVGPGKAVVEVALELITDQEQFTETLIDPESRVAISSDTEERSSENAQPGGAVTVASNLPEPASGASGQGRSQNTEIRERLNYEMSGSQREVTRNPGGIRRMTLAVLVDGQIVTAADGTATWQPRSPEELAALRELVAAAAGYDEARGDYLTLQSMEFQPGPLPEAEVLPAGLLPLTGPLDIMAAIRIAALSITILILALFVLRPLLLPSRPRRLATQEPPLSLPGPALSLPGALSGEIDSSFSLPDLPVIDFAADASPSEDPAGRLRRLISERQAESIEILRGWLEPDEERA
ncbi:flagellar basal-body MS-ring/collar protein FliF [Pseudogemmobacter faecipullorum]|uniref:Flagellar M-ring protein n=1 Tax=Pseudogemmobacter faecipullorum TaxID=2755041 RepID=A0ABS8CJG0_9RHOB|nr:flagellar basal-body MS-ring/collar protein FliF [Pseudogemmobacter faecipullorum]MCB5409510.1 flagellar M-ring protein FliF [Pseudogemmobacter faecipullorum]